MPRSLAAFRETIEAIEVQTFKYISGKGREAAVFALSHQDFGVTQGLVAAKCQLAKKGLTIARLELVSGHMTVKLVENVKKSFDDQSVHGWLESTVALHWIKGEGSTYKQFVINRITEI